MYLVLKYAVFGDFRINTSESALGRDESLLYQAINLIKTGIQPLRSTVHLVICAFSRSGVVKLCYFTNKRAYRQKFPESRLVYANLWCLCTINWHKNQRPLFLCTHYKAFLDCGFALSGEKLHIRVDRTLDYMAELCFLVISHLLHL